MKRLLVEPVALGFPAVRVGVVGRREEPGAEKVRELVRLEGAVDRHQRQGVVDVALGLAGEGDIGRDVERTGVS